MATVDVLIPVFNRAGMLGPAVESILAQTYADFRILIYDDGSTDDCLSEVPKDPRISVSIGMGNKGAGYARGVLLKSVESPLACWQDSDDISHPHRLQKQIDYMWAHPGIDMVLTYMYFFHHPAHHTCTRTVHKVDTSRFGEEKGFWNNLTFATGMFRRKLQAYPFKAGMNKGGEDVDWMRRLVRAGVVFGHIGYPSYYCRRHEGRMTYRRRS